MYNSKVLVALAGFLNWNLEMAHGFYLPGVSPISFAEGDPVKLKVNKMTSQNTLYPLNYYRLPFCQPEDGVKVENENLGEFLAGDRIENSPYVLRMREEMYCEKLCVADFGREQKPGEKLFTKAVSAIRRNYHNNWIVDNLPAASKAEDDETVTTRYWQGFPVGFMGDDGLAYINNHVNIDIMYHPVETEYNKYRIVRFTVEPFSVKHDGSEPSKDLSSCKKGATEHITYEELKESPVGNQLAEGEILFTYDVTWTENLDLHWASRWDIYLSMDNAIPNKVHWLNICNSLVVVLVLTAMVAVILLRNLRKDFSRYNRVLTDEEQADDLDETGWKVIHADVFRGPTYSPLLFSVACGTGAQLLCMAFLSVTLSMMGFLSPANRGALITAQLLLFVLMGVVAGYFTARIYKALKGTNWQTATTVTSFLFPGMAFVVFFLLDLVAWAKGSTDAVPFTTILVLLTLWFGISTPLVFFGAYFGYKQDAIEFPVSTSSIPREIPEQSFYGSNLFLVLAGGILPFGASFVELYFILSSVWMDQYYYVFGFLFLVLAILLFTCAEVAVLFNYFQLCSENYNWWWRSFLSAGSVALYVFIYSIFYFKQLESNFSPSFSTLLLYFGYMGLSSLSLFLVTGFVGFYSCLTFNIKIYGSIKID